MKILALAYNTGAGNAVAASGKALEKRGDEVFYIAQDDKQAGVAFRNYGLDYTLLDRFIGDSLSDKLVSAYREIKPDAVLTGASPCISEGEFVVEREAVDRKFGRPVISVMDSYGQYHDRFSSFHTRDLRYLPNAIAAIDSLCADEMTLEGISDEIIVETGNPHYDYIKGRKSEDEIRETKELLGVSKNDLVGLYGSDYLRRYYGGDEESRRKIGYNEHDALKEIVNWFKNDYNVIINLRKVANLVPAIRRDYDADIFNGRNVRMFLKPHPREVRFGDIPLLQDIVGSTPITFVSHTEEDLNRSDPRLNLGRLLAVSDFYITMFSTATMIESLLENPRRPVISIQPNALNRGKSDLAIPVRNGLAVPVYEEGKLGENLRKVIYENPEEREKRALETLNLDGKSGERVTDLVHKIANN